MPHQDPLHITLTLQRGEQRNQGRPGIAEDVFNTVSGQKRDDIVGDVHKTSLTRSWGIAWWSHEVIIGDDGDHHNPGGRLAVVVRGGGTSGVAKVLSGLATVRCLTDEGTQR